MGYALVAGSQARTSFSTQEPFASVPSYLQSVSLFVTITDKLFHMLAGYFALLSSFFNSPSAVFIAVSDGFDNESWTFEVLSAKIYVFPSQLSRSRSARRAVRSRAYTSVSDRL